MLKSETKITHNDESNIGIIDSISTTNDAGYYKYFICYFIPNSKDFVFSVVTDDVVECSLPNNDSVFDVSTLNATNKD